jgi:hypothetical protein
MRGVSGGAGGDLSVSTSFINLYAEAPTWIRR